jgi:histidine ammonia-lyase
VGRLVAAPPVGASDAAGPVLLDGYRLTLDDVRRVAREHSPVLPADGVDAAMRAARAVADAVIEQGVPAYGLTTGVGVRKRNRIDAEGHDHLVIRQHLIGQGAAAPIEVVRATALLLANSLARGVTAARPELLCRVVERLNAGWLPPVRILGSIGQADLAAMADLAAGLFDDLPLAQGEAIAVLNHSAFATGWAALAINDALDLMDTLDIAGALDLEAFAANPDLLDPAVAQVRRYPGLARSRDRIAAQLAGGRVRPRSLQDPLSFRHLPQINGAARDALDFAAGQLQIELNATQANPLVLAARIDASEAADPSQEVPGAPQQPAAAGRVLSTGSCEVLPMAMALDVARLALAPALTAAAERAIKLLQAPQTGLPEGLGARSGLAECALSEYGIVIQALVAEARLLVAPVCLELASTSQAEGIEDRTTMAPLAARRLAELVELGRRVVAVELLIAAQACDLRAVAGGDLGPARLGGGTAAVLAAVREVVPFVGEGDPLPELEPLVELVRLAGSGPLRGLDPVGSVDPVGPVGPVGPVDPLTEVTG